MARIDSPLKNLIVAFKQTFAEWLLDRPVQSVRLLNEEVLKWHGQLIHLHQAAIKTESVAAVLNELPGPAE